MDRRLVVLNAIVLAVTALASLATQADNASDCPLTNKDLADIGIHVKMIAVPKIDVSAAEYKSDGDPETLEVVFLSDMKDGPSRVSDDGEVIFLQGHVKDKVQEDLITQAFYIRAVLKMGLTARCSGPWTH